MFINSCITRLWLVYPELHATLLQRVQWVGIDGAPSTSNLNATYVGEIKGGLGLM